MRNFVLVFILFLITSCEKELIYPSDTYNITKTPIDVKPTINIWGKFMVIDAVMYFNNKNTGEKIKYKHFGPNKTSSNMRWGGSNYEFERIVKDSTTYSFYKPLSFPGNGIFLLNDDTTKNYCVYFIGRNRTINFNGINRPFSGQTVDYEKKIIRMQIQEVNDGYIHYWTELTLLKVESW